ncbi:MAG: aminotransferase class I/II-fold pyridoxal phosphate-dependent enzyme [Mycobacteriaceae bacterium]|nr:aminotransferase class I/II-fold pyridoxal phosphate-dependent enzyme [Mycobacteriaceae bacterium]
MSRVKKRKTPLSLVELISTRTDRTPDQVVYRFPTDNAVETVSYAELERHSNRFAAAIAATGSAGDRVLVLCPSGRDFMGGFLGCLRSGRIAVPASPPSKRNVGGLSRIVRDSGATVGIYTRADADKLAQAFAADPVLRDVRWIVGEDVDDVDDAPASAVTLPNLSDIAFLQYTSGSTGTPRGVEVRHGNIMDNLEQIKRSFGHSQSSVGVSWLPPFHDMGLIGGLLQPLYADFPVTVMTPMDFLRDPARWLRIIAEVGATTSGGPNFAYDILTQRVSRDEAAQLDLSSWNVAFVGSEPINPVILRRFAEHFAASGFRPESFFPCYGLAESTLIVSGGAVGSGAKSIEVSVPDLEANSVVEVAAGGRELVSSGAVISTEVMVVNRATLAPCAAAEIGEIWLRGPSVTDGYWNQSASRADEFNARPTGLAATEPGYLRTGDLGFLRDGELFVTGRAKELMIIRGRNLFPQDIEQTIEAGMPAVHQNTCAAFTVTIEHEEHLALMLELAASPAVEDEVKALVAAEHGLAVAHVVFVGKGEIPRTTSGKLQRSKARAAVMAQLEPAAPPSVAPTDPADGVEAALAGWVATRIGKDRLPLDPTMKLSALGLDSLKAVELNSLLRGKFGIEITAEQIFDGFRIADVLALAPASAAPSEAPAAVGVPVSATAAGRTAAPDTPGRSAAIEFSLFFFASDAQRSDSNRYRLLMDAAKFADDHGFTAVWTPERHFHKFGGLFPNPSVIGAALAASTSRLRIRAGSVVLPLHDPVRVAEEWSVVDNLSGGRVDVAFATGWNADDFIFYPDKYSNRVESTLADIETVQSLWRGASVSRPNGSGGMSEISVLPQPIQAELPTWLTCSGSVERFRQAGELGANIITALLFQDIEELADKIAAYRQGRKDKGHDPDGGHVTLMLHTYIGADEASTRGTVKQPFINYLADSVDLWRRGEAALDQLSEAERTTVLDFAFERYYRKSALFGTPDSTADRVEQLKSIGIDEIACLIDFGVEDHKVLEGLETLNALRARFEHAAPRSPEPRPAAEAEAPTLSEAIEKRHVLQHRNSRGVLAKTREFTLSGQLREARLLPFYTELTRNEGTTCLYEGRRLIMLGSNNYLGLTADERVRKQTADAALRDGPSLTGSRLMNGSTSDHVEFEQRFAKFLGREDALLFTTGYQANIGLLSALMGPGTVLVTDDECHASVYDGAGVAGCAVQQFRHNDLADLDRVLAANAHQSAMVMVDGVYSMTGDIADLVGLRRVCELHGVPLATDDAHGLGMVGATGRGAEEVAGALGASDMLTGTFSKSLASVGGWVAGDREVIEWVRYHGRSALFSASIPPPALAAASAALDILIDEPWRVENIGVNADYWRAGLSGLGFDVGHSRTAIVPVIIGDELKCLQFARLLVDKGVYANCVVAPAVPTDMALMRTSVMATHERSQLDDALEIFAAAGREAGIIA